MVAAAKQSVKVFLSHSDSDRAKAKRIASELRSFGYDVWMDDQVFPGDNVPLKTGKALQSSDAMVLIVSPQSMRASSVQHELEYALTSIRYKNRLIPVVIRPTREMPGILRRLGVIDARKSPNAVGKKIVSRLKNPRPPRSAYARQSANS